MRPWKPRRHQPLRKLEEDLWAVEAEVRAGFPISCRMCIARLQDKRLLFMNAVPLDEPAMREIEAWGTPAFLLVPAGFHTLDLAPYKARYPGLRVLAGEALRGRISRIVPVDGGWEQIPASDRLRVTPLEGARGEVAVQVGGSLCFPGDVLFNVPHQRGLLGFAFRALGSTGGPRVTRVAKRFIVNDREALRSCLLSLSGTGVDRLVPCHGDLVEERPSEVLQNVAATL